MNCGTEAVTAGAIRRSATGWSAVLLAACLSLPMASVAQVAPTPTTGQDQPAGGLVPPTTVVPAASMRRACLLPSEPVMPYTITRLLPSRKIAIVS